MTRPFPCFTHPFLWISAVLFFSQCSRSDNVDNPPVPPDPDKPFLTITQALPATPFGAQGGSAVLIFSTNEPWRITSETAPESAIDAATWYDIAPPSGDAGGEINVTVKVDPNEEYVGRCFTLILRGETLEERIEVTQAKKNAIIAGDNRLEIGSEERTLTVEVQSNVDYTVSVKEGGEWIEELPESRAAPGLEERTHRFTISANPDAQERTGLIVFKDKASDLFDELTVVQAAWDDPDPERSALRAFYDAAEGGGWTHRENWCSDKPLGEWYGVETDAEGHVTALRSNMSEFNRLQVQIADDILERLSEVSSSELSIPVGTLTGSSLLAGRGPSIHVRMQAVGSAKASLRNAFTSAGINQTRHQVLLDVSVTMSILLPGFITDAQVTSEIAVAETVIVGGVPNTYTYFSTTPDEVIDYADEYIMNNG